MGLISRVSSRTYSSFLGKFAKKKSETTSCGNFYSSTSNNTSRPIKRHVVKCKPENYDFCSIKQIEKINHYKHFDSKKAKNIESDIARHSKYTYKAMVGQNLINSSNNSGHISSFKDTNNNINNHNNASKSINTTRKIAKTVILPPNLIPQDERRRNYNNLKKSSHSSKNKNVDSISKI